MIENGHCPCCGCSYCPNDCPDLCCKTELYVAHLDEHACDPTTCAEALTLAAAAEGDR